MCSLNWFAREIKSLCRYVWEFTSSYKIHVHAYLFANQTVAHFWGFFLFISLTSKRNRHHQQVLNATVHLPRPTPDHRYAHVPCAQEGLPCGPRVYPRGTATEHAILPLRHHQPPHLLTVLPGHSHMIHTWPEGQEVKKKKEKDQMRQKSSLTLVHVSSHKKQF